MRPGVAVAVDLDGCDDPADALGAVRAAAHVVVGRHRLESLGVPRHRWPGLAAASGTVLAVTDGARGWTLCTPDGGVVTGAALPVDVVDDTGAGDCFTGTYLAGIDAGLPPGDAATRAGVAASLSCTVPGARGAPTPDLVGVALRRLDPDPSHPPLEDPT